MRSCASFRYCACLTDPSASSRDLSFNSAISFFASGADLYKSDFPIVQFIEHSFSFKSYLHRVFKRSPDIVNRFFRKFGSLFKIPRNKAPTALPRVNTRPRTSVIDNLRPFIIPSIFVAASSFPRNALNNNASAPTNAVIAAVTGFSNNAFNAVPNDCTDDMAEPIGPGNAWNLPIAPSIASEYKPHRRTPIRLRFVISDDCIFSVF